MSTPGPLLAVDASGCLLVARHTPPVRSPYRGGAPHHGGRFGRGCSSSTRMTLCLPWILFTFSSSPAYCYNVNPYLSLACYGVELGSLPSSEHS